MRFTDGIPQHSLRNYYRDAYEVIRKNAGEDVLVVIPDAGRPALWRKFMASDSYQGVWLDCHLFHHTDHVDAAGPSAVRKLVDSGARGTIVTVFPDRGDRYFSKGLYD
jgi:glucan 1,3-beta-glucosidase